MTKIKKSYGIALCRMGQKGPEIICIRKRYTYHFSEFVFGKYASDSDLIAIFNNITHQEKIDILSLKFDTLWYKIWLDLPCNTRIKETGFNIKRYTAMYNLAKAKFKKNFLYDRGHRLRKLINNSDNAETIWEIPRGKRIPHEKDVDAAIREFHEETHIDSCKYKILWHIQPIIYSHMDNGIVYKYTYYIAVDNAAVPWDPRIDFHCIDQIIEVEAVKWVSVDEIRMMLDNHTIKKYTAELFNNVIQTFIHYSKGMQNLSLRV